MSKKKKKRREKDIVVVHHEAQPKPKKTIDKANLTYGIVITSTGLITLILFIVIFALIF